MKHRTQGEHRVTPDEQERPKARPQHQQRRDDARHKQAPDDKARRERLPATGEAGTLPEQQE